MNRYVFPVQSSAGPATCGDVIHVKRLGDPSCLCGKHVSASKAKARWAPIDTAPQDTLVLLSRPGCADAWIGRLSFDYQVNALAWSDAESERFADDDQPTHWMNLPAPVSS